MHDSTGASERLKANELADRLAKFLAGAKNLAILLVGNPMWGDDGVAMSLRRKLKTLLRHRRNLHVLACGNVPENFVGFLRKLNPTHVLMIDAVDFGASPGEVALFKPTELSGVSLSSHRPSLRMLSNFIEETVGAKVAIIGIQPKDLGFGAGISREVREAGEQLLKLLGDLL